MKRKKPVAKKPVAKKKKLTAVGLRRKNSVTALNRKQKEADEAEERRETRAKKSTKKNPAVYDGAEDDFSSWKDGNPLSVIARKRGKKRREVKKAFIALAGSKEAVEKLRKEGAGGKAFGGKKGGGRTREQRVVDDSQVKRLKASPKWTVERDWITRTVKVEVRKGEHATMLGREMKMQVFVSPKGNRYVRATPAEKADLILVCPDGLPEIRFKKLERSSTLRKVRQEDALVKRGQKAMAAKKKAKVRKQKSLTKLAKKR